MIKSSCVPLNLRHCHCPQLPTNEGRMEGWALLIEQHRISSWPLFTFATHPFALDSTNTKAYWGSAHCAVCFLESSVHCSTCSLQCTGLGASFCTLATNQAQTLARLAVISSNFKQIWKGKQPKEIEIIRSNVVELINKSGEKYYN